jgi:hypothetical protein
MKLLSPAFVGDGAVPGENLVAQDADFTLQNVATEQRLFGASANGRLTLPAGLYFFDAMLYLTGMSATSGNFAFDLQGSGSATLAAVLYQALGIDSTNAVNIAASPTQMFSNTAQSPASIISAQTGTAAAVSIRGTYRLTVAGTIVPSATLVTASAAVVKAGSYFRCWKAGGAAAVSVGAWD